MIAIENVSKAFGPVHALRNVSLSIGPGERVAFVGANGSGKTTLLRAMLGLVRVTGRVTLFGIDVAMNPERALQRVAYVPQIAPPLEAPVREVLSAIATLRGISKTAITDRARALGLEIEACARVRFRDLSGGMKQKLLAAIALAAEPDILICDEPTANLDARARETFFAELANYPKERAVILCSHRNEEVSELVERVIELSEGALLCDNKQDRPTPTTSSEAGGFADVQHWGLRLVQ
jgi:ABC-2 type transport system ATP-binding protein